MEILKLKNTIYEKKKKIGWFNTRLDTIEEKISEPKD